VCRAPSEQEAGQRRQPAAAALLSQAARTSSVSHATPPARAALPPPARWPSRTPARSSLPRAACPDSPPGLDEDRAQSRPCARPARSAPSPSNSSATLPLTAMPGNRCAVPKGTAKKSAAAASASSARRERLLSAHPLRRQISATGNQLSSSAASTTPFDELRDERPAVGHVDHHPDLRQPRCRSVEEDEIALAQLAGLHRLPGRVLLARDPRIPMETSRYELMVRPSNRCRGG